MDEVGKRKLTHNGWPLHHNMSTFGEGTMNSIVFLFTMSHAPPPTPMCNG